MGWEVPPGRQGAPGLWKTVSGSSLHGGGIGKEGEELVQPWKQLEVTGLK